MVLNRTTRTEVEELIASCEVIADFAARADMPEVDDILSRLLFVLTDGGYGCAEPGSGPAVPRQREAQVNAAKALRDQFRAFGRLGGTR